MVRIERMKSGWRLLSRTKQPIGEAVLKLQYKEPNVMEPDAFQAAVMAAVDAVGGNIDRLSLSLPNQIIKASVRTYEALPASRDQVKQMIQWGMEQSLRTPVEDTRISYQTIGENQAREKRLLVAVGFQNVIQQYEMLLNELNIQAMIIRPAGINQLNFYGKRFSAEETAAYIGFFHNFFIFAVMNKNRLIFYHGIRADITSDRFMYHLDMMLQYFRDVHPDLAIERLYLGHPGKRYSSEISEGLNALFAPEIECLEQKEMILEENSVKRTSHASSLHAYSSAIGAAQALSH